MAYKIVWTESASEDLGAIVRFIARHNPDAAQKMGNAIYDGAQILTEFHEAGSVVRELSNPDWRQIIVRPYRIIYHLDRAANTAEIIRIWHGARGDLELPG
jgi:plasmid stabilization system protein ParE